MLVYMFGMIGAATIGVICLLLFLNWLLDRMVQRWEQREHDWSDS